MAQEASKGYGKRPLWQWVLIYVVIGGIIYAGIYYFVLAKKGGSNLYSGTPTPSSAPSTQTAPTSAPTNPILPKY